MASMRASGLIRSYRAYCRLPITPSYTNVNAAYFARFASTSAGNVGTGDNASSSDNVDASTSTLNITPTPAPTVSDVAAPNLQFKWEAVEEAVKQLPPKLTGAIIPFAEQSYLQMFLFPYTYAVMYYMDLMMNYMPWYGAIIATTATCKLVFFPLIVKQMKIGIKSHNILPETQKLQAKVNEAMLAGDAYNTALHRTKMKLLLDQHGLSLREKLWPALVQAPMFMSLFFLLRRLTSEPVESMVTGGALWFTNLTVPDPLFILPLITCTSLFALLELGLGVEGSSGGAASSMRPVGRWIMRGMPVVLFALIYNFPAATLLFWTTNNVMSLVTAILLRQPFAMKKFNIPNRLKHDPASLPLTNQTLSGQLKHAKEMSKASRTTHDIRRLDDIAFKKAGVGPLKKTYKDPPKRQEGMSE